jgi:hypothetical protein
LVTGKNAGGSGASTGKNASYLITGKNAGGTRGITGKNASYLITGKNAGGTEQGGWWRQCAVLV